MAKKFNLFEFIVSQIGKNLQGEKKNEIYVSLANKNEAIVIINNIAKNGGLKIVSVKENYGDFIVEYKDVNLNSPSLKTLLKYDESLSRLEYNDKIRYEDYQWYSTPYLTEIDGAFIGDGSKVEHLAPEDYAFANYVVQERGWKDLPEFMNVLGTYWREELDKYNKEFMLYQIAPEWSYGEDLEEEGV